MIQFAEFFYLLSEGRISKICRDAYIFAAAAHAGQLRKYTGEDYILHPLKVAQMIHHHNLSYEAIAAAILHDTVEDTGVREEDIKHHFGHEVAVLVKGLTDVSCEADGNRAVRKAKDLVHIAKQTPLCKTIKLADLIDNSSSIAQYDPNFAKIYMKEKKDLLEVLGEGNENLYWQAKKIVGNYFANVENR